MKSPRRYNIKNRLSLRDHFSRLVPSCRQHIEINGWIFTCISDIYHTFKYKELNVRKEAYKILESRDKNDRKGRWQLKDLGAEFNLILKANLISDIIRTTQMEGPQYWIKILRYAKNTTWLYINTLHDNELGICACNDCAALWREDDKKDEPKDLWGQAINRMRIELQKKIDEIKSPNFSFPSEKNLPINEPVPRQKNKQWIANFEDMFGQDPVPLKL